MRQESMSACLGASSWFLRFVMHVKPEQICILLTCVGGCIKLLLVLVPSACERCLRMLLMRLVLYRDATFLVLVRTSFPFPRIIAPESCLC